MAVGLPLLLGLLLPLGLPLLLGLLLELTVTEIEPLAELELEYVALSLLLTVAEAEPLVEGEGEALDDTLALDDAVALGDISPPCALVNETLIHNQIKHE